MNNYNILSKMLISTGLLFLIGCSDPVEYSEEKNNIELLESILTRNLAPSSSQSEVLALADNNNKFTFSIFNQLYESESNNIFFSPYSISEALAVAYVGANSNTKTEMASVLNFDLDNDNLLHDSFNSLNLQLSNSDNNYTFEINNAIWIQKDLSLLDSYLDTIKVNYGANIKTLDFINETQASRLAINNWIKEQTHDRIEEVISEDALNNTTRVVLTNTVYFKGEWLNKFTESSTSDDTFTTIDGSTKQTSYMNQYNVSYKYINTDNYQAIELPYKGDKSSMLIIIPDAGTFTDTLSNLESIYQSISNMNYESINLKMPKFEFNSPLYDIKNHLKNLGMVTPFSINADFSNMTGDQSLLIDSISHKAFLKIDEDGTEAAAVTVIASSDSNYNLNTIDVDINRPFIIFIKDDETKQILFMGTIKDL